MGLFDQGVDHCFGIRRVHLGQHDIAGMAFDQGGDLAVVATAQQIAFPAPRYRPVFQRGWTLSDGNGIADPA